MMVCHVRLPVICLRPMFRVDGPCSPKYCLSNTVTIWVRVRRCIRMCIGGVCKSCYITLSGHLRGLTAVMPNCPYVYILFQSTSCLFSFCFCARVATTLYTLVHSEGGTCRSFFLYKGYYVSTALYTFRRGHHVCFNWNIYIKCYIQKDTVCLFLSACARDPPGLEPISPLVPSVHSVLYNIAVAQTDAIFLKHIKVSNPTRSLRDVTPCYCLLIAATTSWPHHLR
jgi:hypothetical protein